MLGHGSIPDRDVRMLGESMIRDVWPSTSRGWRCCVANRAGGLRMNRYLSAFAAAAPMPRPVSAGRCPTTPEATIEGVFPAFHPALDA